MIGKTVSHYQIIENLGQSGMGEVFMAEDTNLNRCGPERSHHARNAL